MFTYENSKPHKLDLTAKKRIIKNENFSPSTKNKSFLKRLKLNEYM
jgi:hypothetical protein